LIAIESEQAGRPGLENRASVSTESDRGIHEDPAARWIEDIDRFVQQDGFVDGFHDSDAELGQRSRVVVGVRFALQSCDKAFVVPDVEALVLAEDVDFSNHSGRVT